MREARGVHARRASTVALGVLCSLAIGSAAIAAPAASGDARPHHAGQDHSEGPGDGVQASARSDRGQKAGPSGKPDRPARVQNHPKRGGADHASGRPSRDEKDDRGRSNPQAKDSKIQGGSSMGSPPPGRSGNSKGNPGKGNGNPGNSNPGNGNPGNSNPGNSNPGNSNPGNGSPGNGNAGGGDPGTGNPGNDGRADRDDTAETPGPRPTPDTDPGPEPRPQRPLPTPAEPAPAPSEPSEASSPTPSPPPPADTSTAAPDGQMVLAGPPGGSASAPPSSSSASPAPSPPTGDASTDASTGVTHQDVASPAPPTFLERVTERTRDVASLLPVHARDFGMPGLLMAVLGGYLLVQRRLDRGPLPMAQLPGELGGDTHVRYDL